MSFTNLFGDDVLDETEIEEIKDIEEIKPGCYMGFFNNRCVLKGGSMLRPWQFLSPH